MSKDATYTPFKKMHGLGNDFIIFDARADDITLSSKAVARLANRRRGIGCDQLIIMRASERADTFMEIWNADGSKVAACGNATRCVGRILLDETCNEKVTIQTDAGFLTAINQGKNISVNMGHARLEWEEIPLIEKADTITTDIEIEGLPKPACVNMGNPHVVFFMDRVISDDDLSRFGAMLEHHSMFPDRVNVSFAVQAGATIRLRVWERGAGITQACGTAACASVVAASRRGLTSRAAIVTLDGGDLQIKWLDDGTVQMTGDANLSYEGEIQL